MIVKEEESVIVTDPNILGGSYPVFRGTRVPFETFLNHIRKGKSIDDFLMGFPTVTRAQALAAIDYAIESVVLKKIKPGQQICIP